MWPFRRRRPEPTGSVRLAEATTDPAAFTVLTVSEHRFPDTYAALWDSAGDDERAARTLVRTASLVPIPDPQFGVADLEVRIDGRLAAYLRPPHLGMVARAIDAANAVSAEAPAIVEWGPVGPTTRLRLEEP
jgi:hypothetical protein